MAGGAAGAASAPAEAQRSYPELPADAMIIVPVRNFVMFPDVVMPLTLGRPASTNAAQAAVRESRPVGILTQRDAELKDVTGVDMHRMGTVANVLRYITGNDETNH
ncbi:MAG: endopeptidase La, partial [Alphaproteobacteria bacterium]